MKPHLLPLLFLLTSSTAFAQIIVKNQAYKANFSNEFHQPRYVSYTLYKGGGDCDRKKFRFINDDERLLCATDEDYEKNGVYEKGHLANAEDFAFDCVKDELTFRYYNCLPQTTNLNKGVWKSNETKVRDWSKKKSFTSSAVVSLAIKRCVMYLCHLTAGR
jgi:endonuclease G